MSLIFDSSIDISQINQPSLNAVFLTQQSYINLLDLVDVYFNFGMRKQECKLLCLMQSYMTISHKPERFKLGVGKNVSLKIDKLIYNPKYEVIIATVLLKTNFTDSNVPHIIISKPKHVTREMSNYILEKGENHIKQLHAPYTVHGKIGIMIGTMEEFFSAKTPHLNRVSRPEATLSVDNSPPPSSDNGESAEAEDGPETYMGAPVIRGARGGKYYIKDGKRRYISEAELTGSKIKASEVVYNINLLSN